MLKIAILIMTAMIINGCADSEDIEFDNRTDFGYNTSYVGNMLEASPQGFPAFQEIATPMLAAIDFGNDIYMNALKVMTPDLFDNSSFYKTEDGDCTIPGFRSYNVKAHSLQRAETTITYNKYCVKNPLAPVNNSTTIDQTAKIEQIKSDNSSYTTASYKLLTDNATAYIQRYPSSLSDNYTLKGIIEKLTIKNNVDHSANATTRIGLDMPEGTKYRFDLYTETTPAFKKYIKFYHHTYGYVTVDLTWMTNIFISGSDLITMGYKDGKSCIFKPEEIGTNDFDCKKK